MSSEHRCDCAVFLGAFAHSGTAGSEVGEPARDCCERTKRLFNRAHYLLDENESEALTKLILAATVESRKVTRGPSEGFLARWVVRPRFAMEFSYSLAVVLLAAILWGGGASAGDSLSRLDHRLEQARYHAGSFEKTVRQTLLSSSESVSRGAVFMSARTQDFWEFFRRQRTPSPDTRSQLDSASHNLSARLMTPACLSEVGYQQRVEI